MDEIHLGSRTLQPERQLLVNGRREPIGKRALDILSVLARANGAIVTKDELLDAVWPGVVVEENALQVHVVALRKALGPEAERLRTIRGVGYQLDVDPEPRATGPGPTAPSRPEPAGGTEARPIAAPSPVQPEAADAPPPAPAARTPGSWTGARRAALVVAGIAALLAGAWTVFGSGLGLHPPERIPVVVRALTASGPGAQVDAALASGITEELIFRLRRMPELRIATAARDGAAPSDAFRNAYVVEGTLRSNGDRLRVAVRLADAKGEILWSDTLDRGVSDLFEMQEEIAAAIAGALSVSFEVGANSARYGGTDNPEAYAAYMQYYAHQWDPDLTVPQRHLERAVALDPHFVKGLFGLSQNFAARSGAAATTAEAEALIDRMDDSSRRALEADPDLALGPLIRGWYLLTRHDIAAADKLIARAAELDRGNDPVVRTNMAIYWLYTGRLKRAASVRQSNELIDPIHRNDPWKIVDHMMLGRYREAVDLYARLKRIGEPSLGAFSFHAFFAHLLMGDEKAALDFAERENVPTFDLEGLRSNPALAAMGEAELRSWAASRYSSQVGLGVAALLLAHDGRDREAMQLLELAFEKPGNQLMLMLWHPALARVRRSPEFEQLATELGLVEAWRESGDWGDFCRPVSATEVSCT